MAINTPTVMKVLTPFIFDTGGPPRLLNSITKTIRYANENEPANSLLHASDDACNNGGTLCYPGPLMTRF